MLPLEGLQDETFLSFVKYQENLSAIPEISTSLSKQFLFAAVIFGILTDQSIKTTAGGTHSIAKVTAPLSQPDCENPNVCVKRLVQ